MKLISIILFTFLSLAFFSCGKSRKATQEKVETGTPADLEVSMERTPCFGTCPVYKVEIAQDGVLSWSGIRFTERKDVWQRQLSTNEKANLWIEIQKSGYFSLQNEYDEHQIADAPSVLLKIKALGTEHSIKDRMGAPESLRNLENYIDTLAAQPGLLFVRKLESE